MSIESGLKKSATDEKILAYFNTDYPHFAYCMGGLRRLSVDPYDARARKMLLAKGPKCFTRNQRLIEAFTKNLPIDLFLDIGTNYGETLVSSPLFSKVRRIGFEPNPRLFPYLRKTLRMNDDLENIEIVNKAVSSEAGKNIEFYVSKKWSGKSSAVSGISGGEIEKILVQTTTIDEQISVAGPITFLLIKLDVEGYEPAVIRGAQKTHQMVPNVLYLMEFDTKFIRKGGEDPRAFFTELAKDFRIYSASSLELGPVKCFDDLISGHSGDELHTDLVMYRSTCSDMAQIFEANILETVK